MLRIALVLISYSLIISGIRWMVSDEPWMLDQLPNEALLQTSFSNLFASHINTYLPEYLRVIYLS